VVVYGTGAADAPLPLFFLLTNRVKLEFIFVYELDARERASAVAGITDALTSGRLVHNIAATFPLDDVVAAHEAVESGTAIGNVVVRLT
jgi:NADPH2:quinone reductase